MTDEQLFEAIKELRGSTFQLGGAFTTPITCRPSFAQIGRKLRARGVEIDDDTVHRIYRARVPRD